MTGPKFLQRIARLPEVINVLAAYPQGLPLRTLAAQFDVDIDTMRQDLVSYLDLESWGWSFDIFHRPAIEFVQPDRDGTDDLTETSGSTVVRIVPDTSTGLGAEHLSAGDLSVLYAAGMALLDVEPHDTDLAEAISVIAATMYGEPSAVPHAGDWNRHLRDLQTAQEQHLKVRIVYSRAWSEGVGERVIEPLRLVQTRRGWEVDAGPIGPEGNLRTYLLANVRSAEVLDERFTPPSSAAALLANQRATTRVRVVVDQDARWAARLFAEHVTVADEDEETVTLDLDLLPPVSDRTALIMLANGTQTKVAPGSLVPGALAVVQHLLHHHESRPA